MARTDEAISRIRELIVTGELHPGARLPPEKQLCAMLGMSRGSVREAVKALEVARVLDVRRGDGTYVTSLEPALLLEGIGFAVHLIQDRDLADVMHVRRILEAEATALAARHADGDLLADLRTLLDQMRAASDTEELVSYDTAFHDRVIAACGNPTLASLLSALSSRTLRARIWRGLREEGAASLTIAQHEGIYAALADRDPEAARAASVVHVATSERWLRGVLDLPGSIPEPA
ncbi:FadR/GntR family transcriptional regulator [Actinopolymorpha alba]|uniref:FadR/GntR family transcriptional regulator n=1 Tax=Actinopolymorpha alba TaxID=533267 RepID=UPI000477194A|nr:FCD domain-containing protein [Actinopolymorpha alba]